MTYSRLIHLICLVSLAGLSVRHLQAQQTGTVKGSVTLRGKGIPIHQANVMLVQLGRVAETDQQGEYVFERVPPGTYDVVAYLASLSSESQLVEVAAGQTAVVDFQLQVSAIREEITVTARGRQETAFEAVHSVTSLDSFELAERMATSVGEILEKEAGVAKRSFGPGSSRPVIRGFDGDRVLVMQDGVRLGSLGSQSGDHGEPIDAANLERLEVVKGPATLLYGSNAIGGVVNAVTGHHKIHQQPHEGIRGQISSVGGTNGGQAGGGGNVEFGTGKWLFWGGGGGQRIGDYTTPLGEVENSKSRVSNASVGLGWYGKKTYWNLGYSLNDGRYGVPFAREFHAGEGEEEGEEPESVDIAFRRHSLRFGGGVQEPFSSIETFRLTLDYSRWRHEELELAPEFPETVGTSFENRQFIYRGVFEQHPRGALSGSFGFWGMERAYETAGEEALAPPVDQRAFALFALQEISHERLKLQLGGRLEHTRYAPDTGSPTSLREGKGALRDRSFTGVSAGAGARVQLWPRGAFVANLTHSYRAPVLEELYNFGPHVGLLAFEVGNPELEGERSLGLDLSLRYLGRRIRGEANLFVYRIDDFIFLAPTGVLEDGLLEGEYRQENSHFRGGELELDLALLEELWLNLGLDWVDARLTRLDLPLPRIPPLRGRVGMDLRQGNFSFRPEVILAADQADLFFNETRTPGYATVNLQASYTIPQQHFVHHLSVQVFNLGDRLYRNHVSFIKDLAPEMGRGLRLSYVVRFF